MTDNNPKKEAYKMKRGPIEKEEEDKTKIEDKTNDKTTQTRHRSNRTCHTQTITNV